MGNFFIGDNAEVCSVEKDERMKDVLNFNLSQLSILIKQTFFGKMENLKHPGIHVHKSLHNLIMRVVLLQTKQIKFKTMSLILFHLILL